MRPAPEPLFTAAGNQHQCSRRASKKYAVLAALGLIVGVTTGGTVKDPSLRAYEPPALNLVTPRIPTVPVTRIVVENGAGKELYRGPGGNVSANPPLSDLDGVLQVTVYSGPTVLSTQTLRHEPGQRVRILRERPDGHRLLVVPAQSFSREITGGGGGGGGNGGGY